MDQSCREHDGNGDARLSPPETHRAQPAGLRDDDGGHAQRSMPHGAPLTSRRHTLIVGGAGFVGIHVAHRVLSTGRRVLVYDNLSRPDADRNIEWLGASHGDRLHVEAADVRDARTLSRAMQDACEVIHLAAQVSEATGPLRPIEDFEVNTAGTLNLLEGLRSMERPVPLLFASTTQVYGRLADVRLHRLPTRYEPVSRSIRTRGINEDRPFDLHDPHQCSRAAAEQYVLAFAHTFGIEAVVFRLGCICGPRQHCAQDNAWMSRILMQSLRHEPVVVHGDGRQVRDLLFIDDLLDAFDAALANMDIIAGQAFNIGGGPARTISPLELLGLIATKTGVRPQVRFEPWQAHEPRYFASNTAAFQRASGWAPRTSVVDGIQRVLAWLHSSRESRTVPQAGERVG
jgi:CDP-paratose 2-epimerase